MGQCLSALGVTAPQPPDIQFPGDDVAKSVADTLAGLPAAVNDAQASVDAAWAPHKEKNEDFQVTGGRDNSVTIGVLHATDEEKVARKFAYYQVGKGQFADAAADKAWDQVQPQIDSQKPDGCPDFLWNAAVDKIHDQVKDAVSKQIQNAIDAAIAQEGL